MDNKVWSQIKRGLKVTGDYLITLVIFGIFSSVVFSLAKDNVEKGVFIFSIVIFFIMFSMMYANMSDVAFKEKRPQYNIHPSPYKGVFYGLIGIIPVFIFQLVYYIFPLFPIAKEVPTLQRRILQAITGPLYWLAKWISGEAWVYHLVLLVIPVITGLGYLAGHKEVYIMRKLKIFDKLRKKPQKQGKK